MTVAATIAPRILLGVLALWLALWPAADGATGASKVMLAGSPGERPAPPPATPPLADTPCTPPSAPAATATGGGACVCCSGAPAADAPAATVPASDTAADRSGCCPEPCNGPPAVPTCPAGKMARCSACCGAGGMVLFATAVPSLEADHAVVGTLCPCCQVGSSRHLQPPVPPPWMVV